MQRRRLAVSATIGMCALALVGCTASAPSVTTAEQVDVPDGVQVEAEVVAAYAVGEHDGFDFTALETDDGWCLAILAASDPDGGVTGCTQGDEITVGGSDVPTVRFAASGVGDAQDGQLVSDWVEVVSVAP